MSRPRIAVAAWLALMALAAAQVAGTRFVADLSSFLPSAPTPEQRLLVDQMRDGALSRVMLMGIEGGGDESRAAVSRALAQALRADPRFTSVANGASDGFERERELVLAHRYALSAQVSPQRFTVEGLRDAIAEAVDSLASPAGMALKALVPRDPTLETLAVIEQLRPAGTPATRSGVWASPDGSRALLIARTRASGSDTDAQQEALAAVEAAFSRAAAGRAQTKLLVTGPGVMSVRARAMIRHDVERLAAVSLAIVAAMLLAVYRSPRALALGLVPVASGALAGVAAVSLGFGEVHGLTLGFGTTLIGEAVDYSIYLFVQSERAEQAADARWLAGFWPTIRLGVLTSIAGFCALLFAGLPGLAQLGVYSIAGLVAAAAVTRFVLPALLPATFRIRDVSGAGAWLMARFASLARWRWTVAAIAVASAAALVWHARALWDADIASLNPISPADRAIDARLRADLGTADARYLLLVRAGSADEALAATEKLAAALDPLVAAKILGGYDSPARALPSRATQLARLESLPPAGELRSRLRAALVQSPLRPERLEPFVEDVARAKAQTPLTREQLAGTAFEVAVDGLLFADRSGTWTALVGLRGPPVGTLDVQPVRDAIAAAQVPGATLLDVKGELDRLYDGYFRRAAAMSLAGLGVIVALLLVALRDARRVWHVMAPLAAGVLFVAAFQVLSGAQLTLLHLVGLLLVVAIGSNYALFFDGLAARRDGAAPRTVASLALANATTVASFGVLAASQIPVLHAIGSTVAIGALATFIFAAMLAVYPLESRHAHAD